MNKSLMISIRPEHAFNILNGNKTLELRKTVPKDYKGWVYIYCTRGKDILEYSFLGYRTLRESSFYNNGIGMSLNGKVVARFWFDEYETYSIVKGFKYASLVSKSCVDINDIWDYAKPSKDSPDKQKWVYTWHIKQLEIFDTPLSLSDFYKATLYSTGQVIKEYEQRTNDFKSYRLKRPPQSWQYVYVRGNLRNE